MSTKLVSNRLHSSSRASPPRLVFSHSSRVVTVRASLLDKLFPNAPRSMKFHNFIDSAPSWEQLAALVQEREAALHLPLPDPTTGPTTPLALKRTFGSTTEPEVKLYRDHAAWCPYCQKVWLLLEEKQIPYTIEKINMRCYGDKPPSFMSKVPSGLLPVLEFRGQVITESDRIMRLLDEAFPARPMMPREGSAEKTRAEQLLKLERTLFSAWLQWLCSNRGKDQFIQVMDTVNEALASTRGPFFLGSDLSMVDIVFVPFLERIVASMLYYKGFRIRGRSDGRFKAIDAWFCALEARETYRGQKSDFYTHCHDLPPQLGGCGMEKDGVEMAAWIDGGAWQLPLPPLSAESLEPHSPGEQPARDRFVAARRLVTNHAAIVRFSLRGVGERGPRPVSAPLADPTAIPDESFRPDADALLRHVASSLLRTNDTDMPVAPIPIASGSSGSDSSGATRGGEAAYRSLSYLCDRIGVPRDMDFPAARQFRAHLRWAMTSVVID